MPLETAVERQDNAPPFLVAQFKNLCSSNSARDYLVTFVAEFGVMLSQFVLYKLYAVMFGQLGFSEIAVARRTVSAVQPAILIGLGIALPRYLAMADAGSVFNRQCRRYYSAGAFCMLSVPVAVFIGLCIWRRPVAELLFGNSGFSSMALVVGLMLLGANLHSLAYSYFRGRMKIAQANLLQFTNMAIVPIIGASISTSPAKAMLSTALLWSATSAVSLAQTPLRQFDWRFRVELKELLTYGAQRVPGDFMYVLMTILPAILCVHLNGIEEGGRVAFALAFAVLVGSLFSPIGVVLLPTASRLFSQGSTQVLKRHVIKLALASGVFTIITVCFLELFAHPLVRVYLGAGFDSTANSIRLVMPAAIPLTFIVTLRSVLDAYYSNAIVTLNAGIGMLVFLPVAALGYYWKSETVILLAFTLGCCVIAGLCGYWIVRIFRRDSERTSNAGNTQSSERAQSAACVQDAFLEAHARPELGRILSRPAREYSLRELARRAGVNDGFFRTWEVNVQSECTVVTFPQKPGSKIVFAHARENYWTDLNRRDIPVAHACWPKAPGKFLEHVIPDFVLPFIDESYEGPLFRLESPHLVHCDVDLLASMLFNLCRVEEEISIERDEYERFPARSSSAVRGSYAARPVVDEYGIAFEQALAHILPSWRPRPRQLRIKVSHDIDHVGIPFSFRTAVGHTLRRHSPFASARDFSSAVFNTLPSYLQAVVDLVECEQRYGVMPAVYWKSGPSSEYDAGYEPTEARVNQVIKQLGRTGVEQGVHPGFCTFHNVDRLRTEVETVRGAIGDAPLGGRQHYLRWSPSTWTDWEQCGLLYDSTVGYSGVIGFRAGTCYPYRPWLIRRNREAKLVEIPLIAMDQSLVEGLSLRGEQCLAPLQDALQRCEIVGGVFALLWHNDSVLRPIYGKTHRLLLQSIANRPTYNLELRHANPESELP